MSGGSFGTLRWQVDNFSDELKERIDTPNEYFYPDTIEKLHEIEKTVRLAGKLMQEVEYLYSGDTGNETFMERVAEIERGYKT